GRRDHHVLAADFIVLRHDDEVEARRGEPGILNIHEETPAAAFLLDVQPDADGLAPAGQHEVRPGRRNRVAARREGKPVPDAEPGGELFPWEAQADALDDRRDSHGLRHAKALVFGAGDPLGHDPAGGERFCQFKLLNLKIYSALSITLPGILTNGFLK